VSDSQTNFPFSSLDPLQHEKERLISTRCSYCPEDTCTVVDPEPDENDPETVDDNNVYDESNIRWQNSQKCVIFKDPKYRDVSVNMCKPVCQDALDEAKDEGRTSNYGCMGFFPLDKEIPWEKPPGVGFWSAPGQVGGSTSPHLTVLGVLYSQMCSLDMSTRIYADVSIIAVHLR